VQTRLFERGANCIQLFRSVSRAFKTIRGKANPVVAGREQRRGSASVFALNDKLSMHEKFHRHRLPEF
jgi:hypothetical protein